MLITGQTWGPKRLNIVRPFVGLNGLFAKLVRLITEWCYLLVFPDNSLEPMSVFTAIFLIKTKKKRKKGFLLKFD